MNWLIQKLGLIPSANAGQWTKKWTTRLQALQLAFLALVALYWTLPPRMEQYIPEWALGVVLGGAGLTTFLTVFAANTLQTKIAVPVKYDPLTPLPPEQS